MRRRNRTPHCGWGLAHAEPPVALVETNTLCGHNPDLTPTCRDHLLRLLDDGGMAPKPSLCQECGLLDRACVVGTRDL